ncbi:MAG: relaxase/mobilization nuclease domain-containing protein [Lachnospiraceae bacterium]|nr:relaxase/mobilization nuclease domain-containing protein [Lachnospiraceae bacterium]
MINTVNIESGRKYTQNNEQRLEIQALSDRICDKYGLHALTEEQKNLGTYKKPDEYRAEQSGQSWKSELKATIDDILSTAISRDDFIRKMGKYGYKVKWSDDDYLEL